MNRTAWENRPANEMQFSLAEWSTLPQVVARLGKGRPDAENRACPPKRPKKHTPKALSKGEETLAMQLSIACLPVPVREYRFCERGWKFDFAWPELKFAVEVDGGTKFGMSRHSRGEGLEEDMRKLNRAALDGWKVMRFTTAMITSGEGIDAIRAAFLGPTAPS